MMHRFPRWFVLPLTLSALPLVACSQTLDGAKVEADIKADIERQGRRLALREVRCPVDIPRQAGAFFRCVGELDPQGTFTINVTQQDDQGSVTWDVPNSKVILNLVKVEDSIQRELAQVLGRSPLVDCGDAIYRANQPGDRFECRLVGGFSDGSTTMTSVLVNVNATGNLDWQEQREPSALTTASAAVPDAGAANPAPPVPAATPATSSAPSQPIPARPAVQNTTTTGPTGRSVNRPYIPGDND